MTLAPQIQEFFAAAPDAPLDSLTVQEQRQRIRHLSDLTYRRFGRGAEPVADVTDYPVPVDGGKIIVRAYRPSRQAPLPCHVELHGGGWWLGSIDEDVNEAICRYRCLRAHCVIFAVEYRLAPEHPFPTAINVDARVARVFETRSGAASPTSGDAALSGPSLTQPSKLTALTIRRMEPTGWPVAFCGVSWEEAYGCHEVSRIMSGHVASPPWRRSRLYPVAVAFWRAVLLRAAALFVRCVSSYTARRVTGLHDRNGF